MTRRKDKIRQKNDSVRKTENLHKSRVYQKQEEICQETKLLKKISDLPTELIRIIYGYMSGNGKLICNYKYDYLEQNLYSSTIDIIEKLSKHEILNFIYKGVWNDRNIYRDMDKTNNFQSEIPLFYYE